MTKTQKPRTKRVRFIMPVDITYTNDASLREAIASYIQEPCHSIWSSNGFSFEQRRPYLQKVQK